MPRHDSCRWDLADNVDTPQRPDTALGLAGSCAAPEDGYAHLLKYRVDDK